MTLTIPSTPIGKRQRYAPEFKARIVAACRQPDRSVASVALAHGLNANLVHKWISKARAAEAPSASPAFLPLAMPNTTRPIASSVAECVRVEVVRSVGSLIIEWPLSDAPGCQSLLRELLR